MHAAPLFTLQPLLGPPNRLRSWMGARPPHDPLGVCSNVVGCISDRVAGVANCELIIARKQRRSSLWGCMRRRELPHLVPATLVPRLPAWLASVQCSYGTWVCLLPAVYCTGLRQLIGAGSEAGTHEAPGRHRARAAAADQATIGTPRGPRDPRRARRVGVVVAFKGHAAAAVGQHAVRTPDTSATECDATVRQSALIRRRRAAAPGAVQAPATRASRSHPSQQRRVTTADKGQHTPGCDVTDGPTSATARTTGLTGLVR